MDLVHMVKAGLRRTIHVGVALWIVLSLIMTPFPTVFAQPVPSADSSQDPDLTQEISRLRSRISRIQTAFDQNIQGTIPSTETKGNHPPIWSGLPGFPGSPNPYHLGVTGFFLDHANVLNLTSSQQVVLNAILAVSNRDLAAAQRQIDQAEEDLWMLAQSDLQIESGVHNIERMKGEQRLAFIRAVGEAASVLSESQRAALLAASSPQGETLTPRQTSNVSAIPQGHGGVADPKAGPVETNPVAPAGTAGGNTPNSSDPKGTNAGMGGM